MAKKTPPSSELATPRPSGKPLIAPLKTLPKPGAVPGKAPDPPKPEKCVKLTDEQRLTLDARVWKSRALRYQAELTQKRAVEVNTKAMKLTDESNLANSEFLELAESFGIDIDTAFEWNDKGDVVYFDEKGNKLGKG